MLIFACKGTQLFANTAHGSAFSVVFRCFVDLSLSAPFVASLPLDEMMGATEGEETGSSAYIIILLLMQVD